MCVCVCVRVCERARLASGTFKWPLAGGRAGERASKLRATNHRRPTCLPAGLAHERAINLPARVQLASGRASTNSQARTHARTPNDRCSAGAKQRQRGESERGKKEEEHEHERAPSTRRRKWQGTRSRGSRAVCGQLAPLAGASTSGGARAAAGSGLGADCFPFLSRAASKRRQWERNSICLSLGRA